MLPMRERLHEEDASHPARSTDQLQVDLPMKVVAVASPLVTVELEKGRREILYTHEVVPIEVESSGMTFQCPSPHALA